jgi:N-terminal 7TM region of histidine kinase
MDLKEMLQMFFIYLLPFLSIVYAVVGIYYLKHKQSGRVNFFGLFMIACAVYSLGYYLEIQTYAPEVLRWTRGFEFFGVVMLPGFGIVYIAEYALGHMISRKYAMWLSILSAALWVAYLTNPLHHLFYQSETMVRGEFGTIVQTLKGPVYYLLLTYYCCFIVLSIYFSIHRHIPGPKA